MFFDKVKKALAVLAVVVIAASTAYAEELTVPQELSAYGDRIYSVARSRFGRSFSGYCGTYVGYQLRVMGICTEDAYFRGNGNQWYANFDGVDVTSGGYYVYREGGYDCLDKLAKKYGSELDNIVLSFPIQAGYSSAYPGAGHALVIYKLKDGIAYYSESFSYASKPEGKVFAEEADKLIERYSRRHGAPIGGVLLSEKNLSDMTFSNADDIILGKAELMNEVMQSVENLRSILFVAERFNEVSLGEVIA